MTAAPTATPAPTPAPTPAGALEIANWPLYIDTDDEDASKHPSLEEFTAETGITVGYYEVIYDNEDFFGTIRPDLAAGKPTPYDLIIVTDWMVAKLAALGYLEPIDVAREMPNFVANAVDTVRDQWFDPGNRYSIPWVGGIVGIGYNIALTGREITSFDDLLDPAFKGRVGMFSEMRDTMCLALLSLGIVPAKATVEDAARAQAKLLEAAQRGQFRGFYGNEYTDELVNGNLAISMAWGGDVFQLALYDNPDLRFVVPRHGGMYYLDNMCIPKNAAHPVDARLFMNHFYQPEVSAKIGEWIGYLSPVKGVPDLIRAHAADARAAGDAETADALLVVADAVDPTPERLANTFPYRDLSLDEERAWNELFNKVLLG
ncbi:MAG: spermidine/putrescine ABC transporter substrate-binding protein [Chloroflexi bacterium]|nr:spermidine/putrescine ABC transporter substrate-binding protein [Chloroflexota bacterium]